MTAQPGPTPEAFDKFLCWLSTDRELAVKEYEKIRDRLVKFFNRKGCGDSDELFDKTVDVVLRKIDTCAEYSSPLAYCHGVAKNIWLEYIRKPKPKPLVNAEVPAPRSDDQDLQEQKLKCLNICMNRLPEPNRDLISRFYQGAGRDRIEGRKLLAVEKGGENTLRIKAFRIRKILRICVTECIKRSAVN